MNKKIKRVGAAVIVLLLLLTWLPLSAFAEGETAATNEMNFSSKRLIVATEDADLLAQDADNLVSVYKDIHILQFDSEEEAKAAYERYAGTADFVEIDEGISIADESGDAETVKTDTVMTEEDNPLNEIEEALTETEPDTYDIALIDTGANDVAKAVSVIGENGADDNGHGNAMAEHIRSINPDVKILSIKALDATGKGDMSAVYAAMQIAIENNVKVINLSISAYKTDGSELIVSAIREAKEKGIIVVGAAGNNNKDAKCFVPGGILDAVIAGACDKDGGYLEFSNYGDSVDYYLPASSTSEAAAKLSGIISHYGLAGIDEQIERMKAGSEITPEDGQDKTQTYYQDGNFEIAWIGGSTGDWDAASFHWVARDDYSDARVAYCLDNGVVPPRDAEMYWFNLTTNKAIIGHILYHGSASDLNHRFGTQIAVWMARGYSPYEAVGFAAESPWELAYIYNGYNETAANNVVSYGQGLYNNAVAAVNAGETFWVDAVDAYWPSYENVQGLTALVFGWTPPGYLYLKKVSSDTSITNGNSNYSLEGAIYYVYSNAGCTNKVGELTTNAEGNSNTIQLPSAGTYYVKEYKASKGYRLSTEVTPVTVPSGKTATVTVEEVPEVGYLKLYKASSNPSVTDGNRCYSLAGAVYTVYQGTATAGTLTTDANGDTPVMELPLGSYTVKETTAPKGYELNPAKQSVTITANHTSTSPALLKVTDTPENDPAAIEITKESNSDYATQYPLEGAQFEIKYYDNTNGDISGTPLRKWIIETKKTSSGKYIASLSDSFLVEGSDELYKNENGVATLPIGTISVEEIKPAMGYTLTNATIKDNDGNEIPLTDGKYIGIITMQDGAAVLHYGNFYTMLNTPIEVHTLAINKANNTHYASISGPVTVIDTVTMNGTDCERLVNEQGEWDYIKYRLKTEIRVLGTDEVLASGVKSFVTDDFDGHMEDIELVIEDPSALEGKTIYVSEYLYSYVTKNVDGEKVDVETLVACEDETVFPDVDDEIKETQRIHFPKIGTTLTDGEDEHVTTVMKDLVLTDTVTYESLIPGHAYVMKGKLMDKVTGNPMKDDDGNEIIAQKTFTPETTDGSVEIEFTFLAVTLHGKSVVAFESVYEDDVELAVHADLEDEDQNAVLEESEIRTTLIDKETEAHTADVLENLVLVDTVAYENLATDAEYTLMGILMDKETGKPLLDDEGNQITAKKTFTPETANGTVEMEFSFPAVILNGRTLVAFEELYYGETLICDHKDLNDGGQTVELNESGIGTTLTDEAGEHDTVVQTDLTLIDTVAFEGLATDAEYTVKGVLMDKETGELVLDDDGNEITSEKTFTPETADGSVEIEFTFPAVTLHGKTVVAFEELWYKEVQVCVHADLEDEDQSVELHETEIGTTLVEKESEEHETFVAAEITLVDTVAYTDVAVGAEYTVKGILMNKENEEPLLDADGKEITAETSFTPEETEGTIDLEFVIPADVVYDGMSVVAFEELYYKDVLICDHEDIDDEGQTVDVKPVELKTTLTDDATLMHAANGFIEVSLTDTVEYTGLIPGRTYTGKGVLMNKETGEAALDENGNEITAEAEFEAEDVEGTVELTFTFKNRKLMGDTLVAFETLFEADAQIGDHQDIEDEDQSVKFPFIGTKLIKNDLSKRFYPLPGLQLNDEVSLKNLDPDTNYLVCGYLVNRTTGYYLRKDGSEVKDKKDAIYSEVSFQASKEDITLNVPFTIDASNINFDIVCFEELYVINVDESSKETMVLVAEHSDIHDEAQTVWFEEAPKTGDVSNILFWTFLALGAMFTATCGIIYNIKKKEK